MTHQAPVRFSRTERFTKRQNSLTTLCPATSSFATFGEARHGGKTHVDLIQPDIYRAPEVTFDIPWSYSADIWMVGVMVRMISPFSCPPKKSQRGSILACLDLGHVRAPSSVRCRRRPRDRNVLPPPPPPRRRNGSITRPTAPRTRSSKKLKNPPICASTNQGKPHTYPPFTFSFHFTWGKSNYNYNTHIRSKSTNN